MANKQDRSNKSAQSKQRSLQRKDAQEVRRSKNFTSKTDKHHDSKSASGNPPRRGR